MRLVILPLMGALCVLWPPCRLAAQTPPTESLTEGEVVRRFMAIDPHLRALRARVEETRAIQAERASYPNPVVTYLRESVFDAEDTFFLARQELPVSGRRRLFQAAGRIAVEAAEADTRFQTWQLQSDVREAYTVLMLEQARETELTRAIASLEQLVAVLRIREEEGEGSSYDRMRGQRALVDLESDLARASGTRARAQGQLAGYLGAGVLPQTIRAADALDSTGTPQPLLALLERALAARGDYRSAQLSTVQFQTEQRAANRLRIPTPTITGGLKRSTSGMAAASGYQFSVDLSVPLFSHGQAATALATAQRARAEAEAEARKTRIEAEVRAAHTVLTTYQERAARYREGAAEIAGPLARIARVAYEEGELGILELLDAERQALDARLRLLELAADARRAAIELDRVSGAEATP